MIAFVCKQCGKRFERPGHLAGTLVFCPCGAGTHVPWESTLPPAEAPVPVVDVPRPRWVELEKGAEPEHAPPLVLPRNAANCLNHTDTPRAELCMDCKEPLCSLCLVRFQGAALCGPCKNYRLRAYQRPPHVSVTAVLAALLSLGAGAVWPFVMLMAAGMQAEVPVVIAVAVVGLAPQLGALLMAALAMRSVEAGGRITGRSWAITAMVGVLVSSAVTVLLALLMIQVRG